ncbi:MAG: CARDB domain-containing protein [Candidatus Methanomethylicaceae archaeon]
MSQNDEKRIKLTTSIFCALLVILPFSNVPVVVSAPPNLNVSIDNATLTAGTNNRVYLTIKNLGDTTALQIWVSLSLPASATGGALMILNGSDGRWYIDSLASAESQSIPITIYVSPSAAGSAYQLTVTLSYQYYGSRTETRTIGVYVPPLVVQGAVLSASFSPYEVDFGKYNEVLLKIRNVGDADAKLVSVTLTMPGATSGSSPLSLIGSDGRWNFELIRPGEEVTIPLTLFASASSAGQTYQLPVSLSYSDYIRTKSETRYLTLVVPFSTSPSVNFEISVTPQDLKAGETNRLRIQLYNKGDSYASYVQVVLNMPPSTAAGLPMVLQGSDGRWLIEKIESGASATLEADVYVSPSASGVAYQASLVMTYYDSLSRSRQETRYLSLNVPAVYSPLAVIDVSINKNELRSGDVNELNLTIKNSGDGTASSLSVSLTIPGVQSVTTSMALLGSDGSWYLGELGPGESAVIPLKIFVSPSASGTLTTFTVTTSYTDANLKSKQQVNYLGMVVRGVVDLVVLDTSTFPSQITLGKPFSITVSLINLGTTTAQSVMVTPSASQGLQPAGYDKIFLGDLAVNVPSSFTLTYSATNITSGRYTLNLEYSYRDNLGQKLTGTLNVPVNIVVSATNASSTNSSAGSASVMVSSPIYIVVVLVLAVIVVGLIYFKKRRS